MNPKEIQQRFFDKKCADIDLTIKDDYNNNVRLELHEFVLMNSCDFFKALILFPNNGKKCSTIEVPNALVVRDIIASFYGVKQNSTNYPEWKYILETFKCKNYLCLPMDVATLYDLEVPPIGFELFLQVAGLFGDITSDHKLMSSIKKNLPSDYDLTIFSEEFLVELFKKNPLIVSGSGDKTIKIWDAVTGECLKTLEGHSSLVSSVAFSSDSKLIVSGGYDKIVKIWDAITGECLKTLEGHSNPVLSAAFSSDSKLIVSGSTDKTIKIWDAITDECLKTLDGHSNSVWSVAFSTDSKLIVSGSSDKTIKIWAAVTGECLKTLEGHSNSVWSVAFSSDNQLVVSGSNDNRVKIWDAITGECLKTLEGHSNSVYLVAFSH